MAMEITNNLSSYAAQSMPESHTANTKSKAAEGTTTKGKADSNKSRGTTDYMKELEKLVPSVECRVGTSFSSAKTGKTLTINPKLLEKMQNNPEKEKEMKELIRGVESMTRLADSLEKAWGHTCVFRHSYIDENGKFCLIAYTKKEDKLNQKLREERRANSEKLIEKQKEKAAKKREELAKMMEEKREEKAEEQSSHDKAKQFIQEKITNSKDGMVYLFDTDFKELMESMNEADAGETNTRRQEQLGANLDLKV